MSLLSPARADAAADADPDVATDSYVGSAALPVVNLIPPEIAAKRRLQRVQVALAGAVVAAVVVVALLYIVATAGVGDARTELDRVQAHGDVLRERVATYRNVQTVYTRVDTAEAMLTQAMGEEVQWSRYLNDLSLTVPDNVWLTSMNVTQQTAGSAPPAAASGSLSRPGIGTVTFAGVAFDHDDVATWLETLAQQKGYVDPYFSQSTEAFLGPRRVVNFTSTVTVTADALSGRYAAASAGE